MRLMTAYLSVILIWSTTPLAIKWSGEGPGFLFGVTARMTIGLIGVLLLMVFSRKTWRLDAPARWSYLAGSTQIFGAMLATYWSSQHIPSGWISVVFGLTPLLTAPFAAFWLGERSLTGPRLLSYVLGAGGLGLIFHSALSFSSAAVAGICGVLLASLLQAISSVWVKRIDAGLPALTQVTGSLVLAVPAYWLVWWVFDGDWPISLPRLSLASILYLGGIATTLGFTLYFFVLQQLPASRVAMITLVTPVLSLYVGHFANHEPLHGPVLTGTGLIIAALFLHETGSYAPIRRWRRRR